MIYIIIILLVAVQIAVVYATIKKTDALKDVFKEKSNYEVSKFYIPQEELSTTTYEIIQKDKDKYKNAGDTLQQSTFSFFNEDTQMYEEAYTTEVLCPADQKIEVNLININADNPVAKEIQRVINNYLIRNKGAASDFGLIKDVVERNTTALEEEIDTQTPWPLYFGLMGTMAGIIIGIGSIGITVGFDNFVKNPAEHIGNLMSDVAIAMVVSCLGIFFTTLVSWMAKNAKQIIEDRKNFFYSWFQSELMPIITKENTTSGLKQLEENLNRFNGSFEKNVTKLESTFSLVNHTSESQAMLLRSLESMDLKKMAEANVTILTKFNDTVSQMDGFNKYIDTAAQYQEELNRRNSVLAEVSSGLDDSIDKSINTIKEAFAKQVDAMRESLMSSGDAIEKMIADQKNTIQQNESKIETFYDVVVDLKPVIEGLKDWKKELKNQTEEIGRLASAIKSMPKPDGNGGMIVETSHDESSPLMKYIGLGVLVLGIILLGFNMFYTISLNSTLEEIRDNQKSEMVTNETTIQEPEIVANDTTVQQNTQIGQPQ